ncbi:MAG: DUF2510 domain-containing protein [Acidimicrobiales bacterium]
MLIFGYGPRRPRDLGPVAPARCPACGNQVEFHLLQQRSWVSLFFVPVIPTSARHLLVCPVCQHAVGLDAHQGRLARGLASARTDHLAGRLDDAGYRAQVDAFWRAAGATHEDDHPSGPTPAGPGEAGMGGGWWPGAGDPGAPAPPSEPPPGRSGAWPSAGHPSQQPGPRPPEPGPAAPPPDPASRRPDPDPGWYPDPFGEADERYWDGARWTQGTKPPRV